MPDIQDFEAMFQAYLLPWAINIALAVVIFVVGRLVVGLLVRIARRLMNRANVDPMLVQFIASILTSLLILVVAIAASDQMGVDTTSFVALIGAAGLAVGLALQKSLSYFAAGVMLILFKPFKVGDYIEAAGTAGVVYEIRIFNTVLNTPDNRRVIVPNGAIYENNITNYSALDTRRIDLVFGIDYSDDLQKAKEILQSIVDSDERILKEPAAQVKVGELAESSVDFVVRPWVKKEDFWAVRWDLIEKVKLAFDAQGISIPFPQRSVHVLQEKSATN